MWGVASRQQNHNGDARCWDRDRVDWSKSQPPEKYFDELLRGTNCLLTDWHENAPGGNQGNFWQEDVPALLGFDDSIHEFCPGGCDQEGYNILQLFGRVPYNTCRNFEWQMCAAKGFLGKQASKRMVFAHAPKDVWMDGWPPFDQCHGYTDTGGCDRRTQFANDDIYPLEVCLFSQVCKNDDELFSVEAGKPFVCEIDVPGFRDLQATLMAGPSMYHAHESWNV